MIVSSKINMTRSHSFNSLKKIFKYGSVILILKSNSNQIKIYGVHRGVAVQ